MSIAQPKTLDEAARAAGIKPLTAADAAELDGDVPIGMAPESEAVAEQDVELSERMTDVELEDGAPPSWALVPNDLKMPAGKQVGFLLIRAKWTDRPDLGDRQCIVWNLSSNDEKWAIKRCRGDNMATIPELSKAMIRAFDGMAADWSGKPGPANITKFWDEIGARGRILIQNYYLRTHSMTSEEQMDFFANCIAVRTTR